MNGDNGTYCDSFRVEHIKKKIKEFIDSKNLTRNIHRTQANG